MDKTMSRSALKLSAVRLKLHRASVHASVCINPKSAADLNTKFVMQSVPGLIVWIERGGRDNRGGHLFGKVGKLHLGEEG